MDLKDFCELIKVEYCWFLYNYDDKNDATGNPRYLGFPFCCHLSANLISSYLSVHVDSSFRHYRFNASSFPHSWSSNKEEVIDFTVFQQKLTQDEKELFLNHKINDKNQFAQFINNYDCYYKKEDHIYDGFDNMFIEWHLYGVKYAENIKEDALTLESFMNYIKSAIREVNSNIFY
ncbi:hypothetical protein [Clostridium tyrobutyricum]|uniref:hypothetical protein n=1 Tax=Clostridium tyrobutyricum TaxID=1519 RepID=UPI001C383521|nr:hypothetical protein [Clostridium tyrobutyricum]MBV4424297.1 hypothetical protein [Clostridium tyrobutyricum]